MSNQDNFPIEVQERNVPTASSLLAQSLAAGHYISGGEEYPGSGEGHSAIKLYHISQYEDFDDFDIDKNEDYEDHEDINVAKNVFDMARYTEGFLKQYADDIKQGMILCAVNDLLSKDVNSYDMDYFAVLGSMLRTTVTIDGLQYKLSSEDAKWISQGEESDVLEINFATGLPNTDREKLVTIHEDYTYKAT